MPTNPTQLFLHIGAPRTATSFLRKQVFPNIRNITFISKETCKTTVNDFFSTIAHFGDGDELSSAIPEAPSFPSGKLLISEEHLIWSVYHMMGNIGSRAMLLKSRVPAAKIILTIRRQPEYLFSIYSYFQGLDHQLGRKMSSLFNMVNLTKEIDAAFIRFSGYVPCGVELQRVFSQVAIGDNYFNRRMRHFIASDFSWFRLYLIYADLFGHDNILVLPQEIWKQSPSLGIHILEHFLGEKVHSEHIQFADRVNASNDTYLAKMRSEQQESFKACIMSLVWQSNLRLNNSLGYLDLAELGYLDRGCLPIEVRRYGFSGSWSSELNPGLVRLLNKSRREVRRTGFRGLAGTLLKRIWTKAFDGRALKRFSYRGFCFLEDRIRGVDFERMESLARLGLDALTSQQYESTKIFELRKVVQNVNLPKECHAIDYGCGKGKVVWYFSTIKAIRKITGVDVSDRCVETARKNLAKLRVKNADIIHSDARELDPHVIDDATLFYFYNPFPEEVFREVIEQIKDSLLNRCPRSGVLIYFNPIHENILRESGIVTSSHQYQNSVSKASTTVFYLN
jgi:hypothetical protein